MAALRLRHRPRPRHRPRRRRSQANASGRHAPRTKTRGATASAIRGTMTGTAPTPRPRRRPRCRPAFASAIATPTPPDPTCRADLSGRPRRSTNRPDRRYTAPSRRKIRVANLPYTPEIRRGPDRTLALWTSDASDASDPSAGTNVLHEMLRRSTAFPPQSLILRTSFPKLSAVIGHNVATMASMRQPKRHPISY